MEFGIWESSFVRSFLPIIRFLTYIIFYFWIIYLHNFCLLFLGIYIYLGICCKKTSNIYYTMQFKSSNYVKICCLSKQEEYKERGVKSKVKKTEPDIKPVKGLVQRSNRFNRGFDWNIIKNIYFIIYIYKYTYDLLENKNYIKSLIIIK